AIARHIGQLLPIEDWETFGQEIPLLVNCMPAGKFLGEGFYRAGGLPAVIGELIQAGKLRDEALTVSGKTIRENYVGITSNDSNVIRSFDKPLKENAGFMVLSGNIFDNALIKVSVISEDFQRRYLSTPGDENAWEGRAIVFEGPEDHRARIDDPELEIDEDCILFIRGCGPIGFPGSAETVSMHPPTRLANLGCHGLPCAGDGRQSGTSASPSILNICPEAAIGGGLAILQTGDRVRVDLNKRSVNMLVSDEELQKRRATLQLPELKHQTPWQEIYRDTVGQLDTGACIESAVKYQKIRETIPRHAH
ncbi:MAG: dihydroxy-acid dehydratase, partial [Verrucomicrobiales bacterium]